jgi:hypothetical protein
MNKKKQKIKEQKTPFKMRLLFVVGVVVVV